MIESEDDVRALVRKGSSGKARWIEPALGSTPGLPDCWVPLRGIKGVRPPAQIHLELKCGEIKNGALRYEVRPEQRREIRAMIEDDVKVGLLIGVKGTDTLVFGMPTTMVLCGNWIVGSASWDQDRFEFGVGSVRSFGETFWTGVNFIFFGELPSPERKSVAVARR